MRSAWRTRLTCVALLSAFAAGASGSADAPQAGPAPPETTPAQKAGWWVRVNPTTQANRVYWRFGVAANQLGAPMSWSQGTSPEALDVPPDQRSAERLHIAALGMPPAAPVSFCLFFGARGVALVEFTQETSVEADQVQAAEQCIP